MILHPLIGLGATLALGSHPSGEARPAVHGVIASVGPFDQVVLLGDDDEHYRETLTFCTWDDPEEARRRLQQGAAIPRIDVMLYPGAKDLGLPTRATEGAAAFDLRAAIAPEGVLLLPGQRMVVPCGFALALPPGWEGQVRARSGLAARQGVGMLNGLGTIDADYRGEVCAILVNHGSAAVEIARGERIAQLVIAQVPTVRLVEVEALSGTARGERGFGSTGRL